MDNATGDNFPTLPRDNNIAIGKDSEIINEIRENNKLHNKKINQNDIDDLKIDLELYGRN